MVREGGSWRGLSWAVQCEFLISNFPYFVGKHACHRTQILIQ